MGVRLSLLLRACVFSVFVGLSGVLGSCVFLMMAGYC